MVIYVWLLMDKITCWMKKSNLIKIKNMILNESLEQYKRLLF